MAYSEPPTWGVGETLTAAQVNTYLRDNMIDLASRFFATARAAVLTGAEFTTTSTTYEDITGASVSLVLARQSTVVLIASGIMKADLDTYRTSLTGSIGGTVDTNEIFRDCSSTTTDDSFVPFGYVYWKTGVAAGAVTVKLQLKTSNAAMTARCGNINLLAIGIIEA